MPEKALFPCLTLIVFKPTTDLEVEDFLVNGTVNLYNPGSHCKAYKRRGTSGAIGVKVIAILDRDGSAMTVTGLVERAKEKAGFLNAVVLNFRALHFLRPL
jgi:hypothetical protein